MIEASVILGIAGNFLIRIPISVADVVPSAGFFLWFLLLLAAIRALIFRWKPDLWSFDLTSLYIAALFFAVMITFFDSIQLFILDMFAIVAIFGVMTIPAVKSTFNNSGTINYVGSVITSAMSAVLGPFLVVFNDVRWKTLPHNGISGNIFNIIRGLAISVPILLIIVGLLMSADAAFESFVSGAFNIVPETIIINVGFSAFLAWGVLGYLRAVLFGIDTVEGTTLPPRVQFDTKLGNPQFSITEHTTEDPDGGKEQTDRETQKTKQSNTSGNKPKIPEIFRLGMVEMCIVLGLINIVFLAFVVFQVPYLFGGMELVQQTPDFKLAEYARRGVGELLAVGLIVLPMLLIVHWLLKKEKPLNEKAFRILASIQIGLLFVILFSAANRLFLLTGSLGYGMTGFRFYAMFLLMWIALVFVWFGMTVLRGKRAQFGYGAFWSGLFIIAMLHVVNPDAFIVNRNIELMENGRSFDAEYNASLSADALPVLIESLDKMSPADRDTVIGSLRTNRCVWGFTDDFRNWNWSRFSAQTLAAENGITTGGEDCWKDAK